MTEKISRVLLVLFKMAREMGVKFCEDQGACVLLEGHQGDHVSCRNTVWTNDNRQK